MKDFMRSPPFSLSSAWGNLLTLTVTHALVDSLGGLLPVILPVVRQRFGLGLAQAVVMLTVINLASNVFQVLTGHLRPHASRPLFLPVGLVLGGSICSLAFLPAGAGAFTILLLVVLVTGMGVAVAHPEALRAVHALEAIPARISTPVFMTGGFFGYAVGAWICSLLVGRWGLPGLLALLLPVAVMVLLILTGSIRLAVEPAPGTELDESVVATAPTTAGAAPVMPFWRLFILALPTTAGAALLVSLLPTRLHELGFSLGFGGFSSMLFGAGGAVGALLLGVLAHRHDTRTGIRCMLMLGLPLLVAYLLLIRHPGAAALLAGAGFCLGSVYSQLVALARTAVDGPQLGMRMAWMVGGAWGVASLALLVQGQLAAITSVQLVLHASWISYGLALLLAWAWLRPSGKARLGFS